MRAVAAVRVALVQAAWRLAAVGLVVVGLAGCAEPSAMLVEEPRGPVEAEASVDRAVATTGDILTFRVSVDHDPAYAVAIPETGADIQGFRIVDVIREEPVERGGRIVRQLVYRLRADLVGSYILPSISVSYRPAEAPEGEIEGVIETSEIFVEVESVLPADGSAEDIVEIKPLRPLEPTRRWWVVGLATALAVLLALAAWRYFRRRGDTVAPPAEPPHVVAFRALDALRATDFSDPIAVRHFYFAISETVRTYVEGRFGLNATDLTSEEILSRLPGVDELSAAGRDGLERFLVHTDRVKFAEYQPAEAEIQNTYESALGFVESTQARPEAEDARELAA